jgi:opacity protein-like surface antigen
MMKRILAAGLVFCCFSSSWAAVSSIFPINAYPHRFYIGAGAGEMFNHVSGGNSLSTGTGWPDDYYTTNSISNQPYGFLSAGYTWDRQEQWLPNYSLGLRYMYTSAATVSGHIDQYSLPQFRNYNFNYDVQLLVVLATLKADIYRWQNFMPYALLGAGIATYNTSNYSEQALSGVTPRVSPGFSSSAGNNFTYQFGIGVDYALRENLWVNVECDYADYGSIRTGKGLNYMTLTGTNYDNESLKNELTAAAVFLGVTYYPG